MSKPTFLEWFDRQPPFPPPRFGVIAMTLGFLGTVAGSPLWLTLPIAVASAFALEWLLDTRHDENP